MYVLYNNDANEAKIKRNLHIVLYCETSLRNICRVIIII